MSLGEGDGGVKKQGSGRRGEKERNEKQSGGFWILLACLWATAFVSVSCGDAQRGLSLEFK